MTKVFRNPQIAQRTRSPVTNPEERGGISIPPPPPPQLFSEDPQKEVRTRKTLEPTYLWFQDFSQLQAKTLSCLTLKLQSEPGHLMCRLSALPPIYCEGGFSPALV